MMSRQWRLVLGLLSLAMLILAAVAAPQPPKGVTPEKIQYKSANGHDLHLYVFKPKTSSSRPAPAILFFHGGGWRTGIPDSLFGMAHHFSTKGFVGISAEYRVRNNHPGTKIPWDPIEDGKSAMRYLRKNAKKLGIDPNKIVAGGASAGGHVAAATATIDGSNARTDDTSISAMPNALVLLNPVYDTGPGGYGYGWIKKLGDYREVSPIDNIDSDMPPTLVQVGTKDEIVFVKTVKRFQKLQRQAGVYSELRLFQGRRHGFFNYNKPKPDYSTSLRYTERFLKKQGIWPTSRRGCR
jgi:acetyl esterase/lipase